MNLNIREIEAAAGDNWEKIKRYYLNLGVWLAPPHIHRFCFHFHVLESFYSYPGIEEFHHKADIFDMGHQFRRYLIRWYGPCWVTQFILDWVGRLDIELRERLIERYFAVPLPKRPFPPRPDPCLTCPPLELIEKAVLGGVLRGASEMIFGDDPNIESSLKRLSKLEPDQLDKKLIEGAATGLKELQSLYARSMEQTKELLG